MLSLSLSLCKAVSICLLAAPVLAQQISQFPDVFFVDGTVYTNIAAAYGTATSGCLKTSSAFLTCEIWDYNLNVSGCENMSVSPWGFTGGEIPVHLRLAGVSEEQSG
jgi:hypothetical protein